FHTRCWLYERLGKPEQCRTISPDFRHGARDAAHGEHDVACHFAEHIDGSAEQRMATGRAVPTAGVSVGDPAVTTPTTATSETSAPSVPAAPGPRGRPTPQQA